MIYIWFEMLSISVLSIFLLLISYIIPEASFCLEEDGLHTKFLPLTPAAAGLFLNAAGYAVDNFGEGAFMVTDGTYQALFLVSDDDGVIVVDCPPTMASKLQYAIGNITKHGLRSQVRPRPAATQSQHHLPRRTHHPSRQPDARVNLQKSQPRLRQTSSSMPRSRKS
jgi:hypothetical protein